MDAKLTKGNYMNTDYVYNSTIYGCKWGDLSHLSVKEKEKIKKIMARVSEKSFRRGFQHGQYFEEEKKPTVDAVILRFNSPLNISKLPVRQ